MLTQSSQGRSRSDRLLASRFRAPRAPRVPDAHPCRLAPAVLHAIMPNQVTVAKILAGLKKYLSEHPEEGPAILLAVQNGEFKPAVQDAHEVLPDYKTLAKVLK